MATVSYEIFTKVGKTYSNNKLRAYVFAGQIIIRGMTPLNYSQLKQPIKNSTICILPCKEHIPTTTEKTPAALKTVITKRMRAIKKRIESVLREGREQVVLLASGNYKKRLTRMEDLSP